MWHDPRMVRQAFVSGKNNFKILALLEICPRQLVRLQPGHTRQPRVVKELGSGPGRRARRADRVMSGWAAGGRTTLCGLSGTAPGCRRCQRTSAETHGCVVTFENKALLCF